MNAVKWGIVGLGEQARKRMVPALKKIKEIEIVSVCCSCPERVAEAEQELGVKGFGKFSDFLDDPEAQVVYISTPHHLHTPQAFKALEAGKNVLVEKPIALSVDGAHKLAEAAARKEVRLGTCFPLRHHPALKELKDDLSRGELGELIQAYVYLSRGKAPEQAWWRDQFHSGPMCMMDLGLQGLDLLFWMIGKRAREVSALGTGGQSDDCVNTAVSVSINFEGGATGIASSNNISAGETNFLLIQGTGKQIQAQINWPDGDGTFKLIRRSGGRGEEKRYEPVDLYKILAENFNRAVLGKGDFPPAAEECYPVVEACCAGIASLKKGRVVKVGEIQRVSAPRYQDRE